MIVARHVGEARIVARRELRYADGGDAATGRPAHVRAASGLAWQRRGSERVLIAPQDDTSFLAVFRPPDGAVTAITLDHAPGGVRVFGERDGTKKLKLDLESIAAIDDRRALAVGSGSHENRRRIVVIDGQATRIVDCAPLYEMLRARTDFAGSELNIEGAATDGTYLYLANRGNGAAERGLEPVDAIALLPLDEVLAFLEGGAVPSIAKVLTFDLGRAHGARLTFTDLAYDPSLGLCFLAAAEKSPNAYDDGEVVGAAIGVLRGDEALVSPIVDESGAPSTCKPEGLAIAGTSAGIVTAYVVVDADDPDVPSDLLTITLAQPTR